jgi:endonuclease YncB( thermonuclease family)
MKYDSELDRFIRARNRRDAMIVVTLLVLIVVVVSGVVTVLAAEEAPRQPVASHNLAGALCEVTRVIDGDTLEVDIIFSWDLTLRNQTVRCLGYDAWESSKRRRSVKVTDEEVAKGKLATSAFAKLLDSASAVYLVPGKRPRGPYGRILATVMCRVDGRRVDVADWMMSHGHVRQDDDQ